jgi:hypothetical protein
MFPPRSCRGQLSVQFCTNRVVTPITQRLADVLLLQAVRAYVAEHGADAAGWIGALSDKRIGGALTLMYGYVGHGWTVGELASAVAMSVRRSRCASGVWWAWLHSNICGAGGCSSPKMHVESPVR